MAEVSIRGAVEKVDGKSIKVSSAEIVKKIDRHSRILNATLTIKNISGNGFEVKAQSNDGGWAVIDYITEAVGGKISVNITEEVGDIIRNDKEKVLLQLDCGINFDPATDAELQIEYVPERIMHESNAYYDVDAGRAGSGKVNLATGNLQFIHSDSAISGISHVYNSWQAGEDAPDFSGADIPTDVKEAVEGYTYGCGKGWKLNLHQYLIKHAGMDGQDSYTYIDGNGNYHEFIEKFYAEIASGRKYYKREEITINPDGKLIVTDSTGKEQIIKKDIRSTSGFELCSELKGFQGIKSVEVRSEELIKIQEELENLRSLKSELEFAQEEYSRLTDLEIILLQNKLEADTRQLETDSLSLEKDTLLTAQERAEINNMLQSKEQLFNLSRPYRRESNESGANFDGYNYIPLATDLCPAGGDPLAREILVNQREFNSASSDKTRNPWICSNI